jgi:hypothetical protein
MCGVLVYEVILYVGRRALSNQQQLVLCVWTWHASEQQGHAHVISNVGVKFCWLKRCCHTLLFAGRLSSGERMLSSLPMIT